MKPYVCLIEDDPFMSESLIERMKLEGYEVEHFSSGAAALEIIPKSSFSAIVSDIRLPDIPGDEIYQQLSQKMTSIPPTLFITGKGSIDQAVKLLRLGAADYQTKPLDIRQFLEKLKAICQYPSTEESESLHLGISHQMREIEKTIRRLAHYPEATVLIEGETGVGKEVVAQLLHEIQCPNEPFEAINCAALSEGLASSEIFGHTKGAFTGAIRSHSGAMGRAGKGVLFLDEIGDMSFELQAKLLRAIQERAFTPLGAEKQLPFVARIMCATHRNLIDLVRSGQFREDLYYRLNVIQINIPPLRDRPEDIVWLAEKFLSNTCKLHGQPFRTLSEEAKNKLCDLEWHGNVRELKHQIERTCILTDAAEITPFELCLEPHLIRGCADATNLKVGRDGEEQRRIISAMEQCGGNVTEAAEMLGISRKSLWQKRKKYGLS